MLRFALQPLVCMFPCKPCVLTSVGFIFSLPNFGIPMIWPGLYFGKECQRNLSHTSKVYSKPRNTAKKRNASDAEIRTLSPPERAGSWAAVAACQP